MGIGLLVSKLRRAVKNIRFLLNFNLNKLKLAASVIGRGGTSLSSRRLGMSFNYRMPGGLMAATDDDVAGSCDSGSSFGLQRTMSCPSEDDIDKRADIFIANFYRQLQIERQVSLELMYCRGNSFGSPSP